MVRPRRVPLRVPKAKDNSQPPTEAPGLACEIGKKRPFDAPEQEVFLNLARTTAVLGAEFTRLFREHGLSESGYNVLRILRGAGDDGFSCSRVGEHLVTPVPDVTRLIDGLVRRGLAKRSRGKQDGRVVIARITPAGQTVLKRLDGPVLALHKNQLGHMGKAELAELSRLLVAARGGGGR